MGRRRRLVVRAGVLAAAVLPFALDGGAASAAIDEDQRSITFTYQGQPVTCRLFGQSNTIDGTGSASSSTNGADDDRCASHLFVRVDFVDAEGQRRSSGSVTYTGHDVDHFVEGVAGSFSARHTARFLNCVDPDTQSPCELVFSTTPK